MSGIGHVPSQPVAGHHISCLQSTANCEPKLGSHTGQTHVNWYFSLSCARRVALVSIVSQYEVKSYFSHGLVELINKEEIRKCNEMYRLTSEPAGMSWSATAVTRGCGALYFSSGQKVARLEQMISTLRSQLWLIKAARGETATPIDLRSCVIKEYALHWNFNHDIKPTRVEKNHMHHLPWTIA